MEVDEILWVAFLGGTAGGAVCREYVPVWVDGDSRDVTVILEDWVVVDSRVLFDPHDFGILFLLVSYPELIIPTQGRLFRVGTKVLVVVAIQQGGEESWGRCVGEEGWGWVGWWWVLCRFGGCPWAS